MKTSTTVARFLGKISIRQVPKKKKKKKKKNLKIKQTWEKVSKSLHNFKSQRLRQAGGEKGSEGN